MRKYSSRIEAIGYFSSTLLALLCTVVLALQLLSGLPSIMAYGVLFAVMVFVVVCGVAFMKTEVTSRRTGPPTLEFSNPPRRKHSVQRQKQAA